MDIWVFVQQRDEEIEDATYGLVTEARRLIAQLGEAGRVTAVALGPAPESVLAALGAYGVHRVLHIADVRMTRYQGEIFGRVPLENALNRCLDKAKLRRIRIHDLRHTYATIRLMRGHNVGDVSYQLGHSSIKMTYDVYTHWIPGHFKSEVDELDQVHPNAPHAHPKETSKEIL